MDPFTKTAVSQDIANRILKTMNVTAEICQKKMDPFTKTAASQDIANRILKTMNVIAEICQKQWTLLQCDHKF
jgi:hypothetical protein